MKKYKVIIRIFSRVLIIIGILNIVIYGIAYVMKDRANRESTREICKQVYEGPKNIINLVSKKLIKKDIILDNINIDNLLKQQNKIIKQLNKEYSEFEYTWRNPYIKVNPYGTTPLSALIKFKTDEPMKVTLIIKEKKEEGDLIKEFTNYEVEHEHPILGLYPKFENEVILKLEDKNGNIKEKKLKIKTEALSYITTPNYILKEKKDNENRFYYTTGNGTYVYDEFGNIRYYLDSSLAKWTYKLKNGKLIGEYGKKLYEFNMLGKLLKEYDLKNYSSYHHGVYELPNGNILEIGSKEGTRKLENGENVPTGNDIVIELDRNTGKIIKEWDLGNTLDTTRYVIGKSSYDWVHTNSVQYIKEDNSLLLSGRWYGMFKINYTTGELKWVFGPNKGYKRSGRDGKGEELSQKVLTAIDKNGNILDKDIQSGKNYTDDFKWPYNTHDARYVGDNIYTIFDNNGKVYDREIKEQYNSRAVIYEITNSKIKQIWNQELPDNSNLGSSVKYDKDKNEVIVFMSREKNKNTTLYHGKILRYSFDKKEKIFEGDIFISPQIIKSDTSLYSDYHYRIEVINLYD